MADDPLPVVKGVYVCDDVLADPASGKVSLLNAFDAVRPSSAFPFVLGKMTVVVALRGGAGRRACGWTSSTSRRARWSFGRATGI